MRDRLPAIALVALILVAWEAYVRVSGVAPVVLPAPSRIAGALWDFRADAARHAIPTIIAASPATRVVVLPTGYACALTSAPRSALGSAIHALTLLIQQRLVLGVAAFEDRVGLVVLPPLCPLAVSSSDFRHADELIARSHAASAAWLDEGAHRQPHPARHLSLHDHPIDTTSGGHAA